MRRRSGFTVVEALAAGTILALSAAVLGPAVSRSLASLSVARDQQRAAELLDMTLRKVDIYGPGRMDLEGPQGGQFGGEAAKFSWEADVEPLLEGDLYEVTVTIRWQAVDGGRSVDATTLINDPPGTRNVELEWEQL